MPKFETYVQGTPSYVELITPDQAAAKEFYGPLFGWEIEEVPMGDAGYYVDGRQGRVARSPGSAARCRDSPGTRRGGASTSPSTTSTRPPRRSPTPAARWRRGRST